MAAAGREALVAARVARIAGKPDFPAFSQQIEETLQVLADEDVSVQQLGELVLRNYVLTVKVLRAANAFGVNRAGTPIFSVGQAIFRLGVERVRSIVSGLVFFEHFHTKTGPVKELVLLSLVTAHQAADAASRVGYARPEEAYLCGMLRNLGEILIAYYFPEDHARIRAAAARPASSAGAAVEDVLGFSYDDLGRAVAARWGMPPAVGASMTAAPAPMSTDPLGALTSFAHELTAAVYRGDPAGVRSRIELVTQKQALPIGLTAEAVKAIAEQAAAELRRLFAKLKAPAKDLGVLSRLSHAFGRDDTPTTSATAAADHDDDNHALLARLERDVDEALESPSRRDLQAVLLLVLEAMQRGAGLDRVLFGLVTADRRRVEGRLAIGANADALKDRFSVAIGRAGGPLGTALERRQDFLLRSDWDLSPDERIELTRLGARMCGALPIVVQDRLVGCLYFDRMASSDPLLPDVEAGLRRLRDRTVLAMSRPH